MFEEDLDGSVHDAKGREASNINNAGTHSQVEYLVSCWGQLEVLSVLQGVIAKRYGGSDKAPGEAGS